MFIIFYNWDRRSTGTEFKIQTEIERETVRQKLESRERMTKSKKSRSEEAVSIFREEKVRINFLVFYRRYKSHLLYATGHRAAAIVIASRSWPQRIDSARRPLQLATFYKSVYSDCSFRPLIKARNRCGHPDAAALLKSALSKRSISSWEDQCMHAKTRWWMICLMTERLIKWRRRGFGA